MFDLWRFCVFVEFLYFICGGFVFVEFLCFVCRGFLFVCGGFVVVHEGLVFVDVLCLWKMFVGLWWFCVYFCLFVCLFVCNMCT